MSLAVDVRKAVRYPPEALLAAAPVDLSAGENRVADYTAFSPYVLVFQGLSFARLDGASFYMDIDGITKAVYLENLASAKGLDYEESLKVPAATMASLKIYSPSAVPGYQMRYRVLALKPTAVLKLQLGVRLSPKESELAKKFDLEKVLKVLTPKPFDLATGVERIYTVMSKHSVSGAATRTVLRVAAPSGYKAILLAVSATRPDAAAKAYLTVSRDDVDAMSLDLYCLPSLSYDAFVRVVATDKLIAELDIRSAGDYYVRLVYGVGKLTLREKIMWNLELSEEERREAEELDLFDKVLAGVE